MQKVHFPASHVCFQKVVATQIFFGIFIPILGEDEPILPNIFQMGWFNHQLENDYLIYSIFCHGHPKKHEHGCVQPPNKKKHGNHKKMCFLKKPSIQVLLLSLLLLDSNRVFLLMFQWKNQKF